MKQFFTLFCLCLTIGLTAQVSFNANTQVTPYSGLFRPGVNPSFYPNWTSEQVADVAAGNSLYGIPGVGVKTMRTAMSDDFVTQFGYDYLLPTYDYYGDVGLTDLTVIVGFPHSSHQEQTEYCPGIQSEMFAGLYEPIWDGGANGTPYNDDNLFAAYMHEVVTRYTPYVKFWEIWNEPGFDYSGQCGWREPGDPVCNWWDQNPDPCDNKLRAPIESYVRTLRIAYEIIKTISEDDYVVVAGVGFDSFLDAILRNTDNPNGGNIATAEYPLGGGAYFDVMGFHSYPHFDGSTIYYDNNIGGLAYERHSDRAAFGIPFKKEARQNVLNNYGYDGGTYPIKGSIITEINIPRDPVGGQWIGSEEAQKNYIIKAVVNAMKENVSQIHVFRLGEREYFGTANNGQTGNPEFNLMGLYQRMDDIQPYEQIINIEGMAYKTASDCLFGTTFDQAKTDEMNLSADLDGGAFLQPNGEYVYVVWAKTTIDLSESASGTYSFPASFELNNVWKKEWDFSQNFATGQISSTNIPLNATPIFLTKNEFVPPATIILNCPDDLTVFAPQNASGMMVNYDQPDVSTTCDAGLNLSLTGGLASGSIFPIGTSEVEYEATDDCGNVVICSFSVTVQAPIGGCPDEVAGFTLLGEFEGHKYFISDEVGRPAEAQVAAQTVGGHLAVINSAEENNYIQSNISELVYIGLNDATTEGTMEWVNGEPLSFTNYDPCAFCNPNSDDDDYVVMHSWNGGWSFSNQFNKRLYVIEFSCDGGTGSSVTINCPSDITATIPDGQSTVSVNYDIPTGTTTCPDGGLDINISGTGGPTAGGISLSAGIYEVSWTATDACGNEATCNFTITVEAGNTGGGDCPDEITGFTVLGEFGDSKYYISNDVSRPVDAQAVAELEGGYLAVISSQEENDFIQQNISEMTYIGLNDFDVEGNLVWVNGEALTYDNINPCGFCNENSDDMDFVIMAPWDGAWSFSNFYNNRKYVMEIPCGNTGSGLQISNCNPDIYLDGLAINDFTAMTDWTVPTATTDCPDGGVTITQVAGPTLGSGFEFFPVPSGTPIVYEITDACGNSDFCITYVYVDPEAPQYNCPADITVTATSSTGAIVTYDDPTLISYCTADLANYNVISGLVSGSEFPIGTTTVQLSNILLGGAAYCLYEEFCSFTVTVESQGGDCPDNLPGHSYLGEFNGSAYFLSDDVARAEDAEMIAQGVGGHLVTIGSQSENDFLQPFISGVVYIGLNDATTEGTLEWFSGEAVNYTNFDICGFCNANADDQDYAVMHSWNGGWSWSNFWNQRQYIVEVPCLPDFNNGASQGFVVNNNALTNEDLKKPTLENLVPNPASEYIFVKINSQKEELVNIQIFDARGTLVKIVSASLHQGLVFTEIEITDLPNGLYFVKIPEGQKKHSQMKFVKQNK
ncbi:MAG: HYR domain-containing protein [Saprospiraceae bacterium]